MKRLPLLFIIVPLSAMAGESFVLRVRAVQNFEDRIVTQYGTGVVLDAREFKYAGNRYVLTAAHVVKFEDKDESSEGPVATGVFVEQGRGKWVRCEVILKDTTRDLVLLEAAQDLHSSVKLADPIKMIVSGSPEGRPVESQEGTFKEGKVACPMAHGMSGGAVINKDGQLGGLITLGVVGGDGKMRADNAIFVSADCIREFLERR
jgi:S1-C subfamily serine protease